MLNMFQTLIHPSSGACDFSIESPHWSCVADWSLLHGYHPNPATLKLQHTSKQEHATNVKSQAPDDGCINVRNMLSIEEVK